MSDNPLDRIPIHDRVSLRAIIVRDGEDPWPALEAAGILEPIALPIVFGEHDPDASFGDGITPNLTAVLEPGHGENDDGSKQGRQDFGTEASHPAQTAEDVESETQGGAVRAAMPAPGPSTVNLSAAYGERPLAPVRRPR